MSDDVLVAGVAAVDEERAVAESGPADASEVLAQARRRASAQGLSYAGGVPPQQAWTLFSSGAVALIDVRSAEERKFVGHVPGSLHVAWASGPPPPPKCSPKPVTPMCSTCSKASRAKSTSSNSAARQTAGAIAVCPGCRIDAWLR